MVEVLAIMVKTTGGVKAWGAGVEARRAGC
jgi:hypothetical protein